MARLPAALRTVAGIGRMQRRADFETHGTAETGSGMHGQASSDREATIVASPCSRLKPVRACAALPARGSADRQLTRCSSASDGLRSALDVFSASIGRADETGHARCLHSSLARPQNTKCVNIFFKADARSRSQNTSYKNSQQFLLQISRHIARRKSSPYARVSSKTHAQPYATMLALIKIMRIQFFARV
jgi:hypothetical protein